MLSFSFSFTFISALVISSALGQGGSSNVAICDGAGATDKPYRDSEVLLHIMRDQKVPDQCKLLPTPRLGFSTSLNQCWSPEKKGQCTEWVDGRYYQLTTHHMAFNGNATDWPALARQSGGWKVSKSPTFPSVAILPYGLFGSGPAGHAAVVESPLPGGKLCTSNWNAPTYGRLSLRALAQHPSIWYISKA